MYLKILASDAFLLWDEREKTKKSCANVHYHYNLGNKVGPEISLARGGKKGVFKKFW